jgi:hypothetical protein
VMAVFENRRPADPAQHLVETRHQSAERQIPDRDHHPEARPGQSSAERRMPGSGGVASLNAGASTPLRSLVPSWSPVGPQGRPLLPMRVGGIGGVACLTGALLNGAGRAGSRA